MLLRYFLLFVSTIVFCDYHQGIVQRTLTEENCRFNPCLNGGTCIPGKSSCTCTPGWMGRYCHKHCRNIYKSCGRWALEGKCEQVRTRTNFFEINCAVSCHRCIPDSKHTFSSIPVPPILGPLQFMVGRWHSMASQRSRYPTDMYSSSYEEVLDVVPAEVPMFGTPSLNVTSICRSRNDTRVLHGFLTLGANSFPVEVAVLSSSNEGLTLVELGTIRNHVVTLNISYMQVHPSFDTSILPLGGTRRFQRNGQFLEMIGAKLFPHNKIARFKRKFRKIQSYPL